MILDKRYNTLILVAIGLFALLVFWVNFSESNISQKQKMVSKKNIIEEKIYVALVLDDFGYNLRNIDALKKTVPPITFAILPDAPFTEKICEFALENKIETIVHLPLEPENAKVPLEENTITLDMDQNEIGEVIKESFKYVSTALGASNHMGSKATKDLKIMSIVMEELKKLNKYYLDSYTTNSEICKELADKYGVKYLRRDVFLDNEKDPEKIKEQFKKLIDIARKNKYAIGIGHDRVSTVSVLEKIVREKEYSDINFVYLSELINKKRNKK